MKSRLEDFVRNHREEFDTEEPDDRIWERLRKDIDPEKKKQTPLVRISRTWWSAAAAVVLVIGGTTLYFMTRTNSKAPDLASTQPVAPVDSQKTNENSTAQGTAQTAAPLAQDSTQPVKTQENRPSEQNMAANPSKPGKTDPEMDQAVNEEMYHYAKLVEIKHKELKAIEKDEPLLYKQFASDVSKLDSVYRSLQSQLPKNPNREQLLEAMLQNLQLQMGLLNHQLDIIKQINHSKKTEYEKAYKTL